MSKIFNNILSSYELVFINGSKEIDMRKMNRKITGAVGVMPNDSFIGWTFRFDGEGDILGDLVSSECVSQQDAEWLFEDFAQVLESNQNTENDLDENNRTLYALTFSSSENKCNCLKSDIEELVNTVKNTRSEFTVLTIKASDEIYTALIIRLSGEPTLRIKAPVSMAFSNADLTKIESFEDLKALQETLTDSRIESGIEMLGYAVSAKGLTILENDDTDYFTDELEDMDAGDDIYDGDRDELSDISKPELSVDAPIEDLDLSVRAFNCIKRYGVHTVKQLLCMSDAELMSVRNLGKKCYDEIKEKIKQFDFLPSVESEEIEEPTEEKTDYIAELNELIGLTEAKEQVKRISALVKLKRDMEECGKTAPLVSLNMEFVGNPGTAKTTVARILAGIYHEMGLLSSADIVEVGRADLVGKYVGHTAQMVREVFEKSEGKLLFIDEAYSLVEDGNADFGAEAINTIVQEMENRRDKTLVIFAGYPKEMEKLFQSNPGLRSRVPYTIHFNDYNAEEMQQIVDLEARKIGFSIEKSAELKITELCRKAINGSENGNGRYCRNLVENAIISYALRVYGNNEQSKNINYILTSDDFYERSTRNQLIYRNPIGFRMI